MTEWLTVPEAALLSGYHANHLRRLIRSSEIKAQKRGGRWWVDKESVEAYIAAASDASDARYGPKNAIDKRSDSK